MGTSHTIWGTAWPGFKWQDHEGRRWTGKLSQRCDNKMQSGFLDQKKVINGETDIWIRSLDSLTVLSHCSFHSVNWPGVRLQYFYNYSEFEVILKCEGKNKQPGFRTAHWRKLVKVKLDLRGQSEDASASAGLATLHRLVHWEAQKQGGPDHREEEQGHLLA